MRSSSMSHKAPPPPVLPEALPVMILPGAVFFPHSLLPLYIFEEKYRDMLEFALERDRIFCIGLATEEVDELSGHRISHPVGGAGVVRACVRNADGTSNLLLQGVARVRFVQFLDDQTFPYARVEPILSVDNDSALCGSLRKEILALLESPAIQSKGITPQLLECVRSLADADAMADVLGGALIVPPAERVALLEEASTSKRLKAVRDLLIKSTTSEKNSEAIES